MSKTADRVMDIAEPLVEAQNLKLIEVDYLKEGDDWILRVFIENPNGDLKLEQCENVSRMLSQELDRIDPIDDSYILEVSSPGLERPLKTDQDFEKNIGEIIFIKTYAPFQGQKEFTGKLLNFSDESVKIQLENNEGVMEIPFSKIANSRLTIDF